MTPFYVTHDYLPPLPVPWPCVHTQAMPIAVGLCVGTIVQHLIDSFVEAFVAPLFSMMAQEKVISSMSFSLAGAEFAYGRFIESLFRALFTIVAVFYLVVLPMKYCGPLRCAFS